MEGRGGKTHKKRSVFGDDQKHRCRYTNFIRFLNSLVPRALTSANYGVEFYISSRDSVKDGGGERGALFALLG